MAKRYAFWKTPWGTPHKGADGKYAPVELIKKQVESAMFSPEGEAVFPPFCASRIADTAIRNRLSIIGPDDVSLDEAVGWGIFHDALLGLVKKLGKGVAVPYGDLMKEVDNKAAAYFRQPIDDFILKTSLSVKSFPWKKVAINERVIAPCDDPGRFGTPEFLKKALTYQPDDKSWQNNNRPITISTKGRAFSEAVDLALNAIHLLRGIWTLFSTHGNWKINLSSSPKRKPIGVIHTGMFHTLHKPDGSPATEIYWFDYPLGDIDQFAPKGGWDKLEKHRKWAINKLAMHPFKRDVESLLIRYAAALDHPDHNTAFLQLWSILESIADSDDYDDTIKRTVWIYSDRKYHKEMLESLRLRRNQYVHAAQSGDGADHVVYMIKSFVDPHLVRLIRNEFRLNSLAEYGEFLSQPTDPKAITKRKRMTDAAARWLKKHDKP